MQRSEEFGATGATRGKDPGECRRCSHARSQRSAKGSEFWRCGLAEADERFPRYPRLPVRGCAGFERGDAGEDG